MAHLRLDRPAPGSARAALEPAFGQRFAVFVDTEEEFDWNAPFDRRATQVSAMRALPTGQSFFRGHGVAPTYLIDYPVATNAESAAILRGLVEADEATIGAHLHPWVTPPHDEEVSVRNSFAGNLPVSLEAAKLAAVTAAVTDAVGLRPTVFRAGRYGVGPNTRRLLSELKYRMDTSVRPYFDFSNEGGPDFSRSDVKPFWTDRERRLLCVPLSTAYVGNLRRFGDRLFPLSSRVPRANGALSRLRLLQRIPLGPEGSSLAEARDCIAALAGDGVRLFSLSFHSPSLEIGHTPYVRDRADLRRFYTWWDGVFETFARMGVSPARPRDIIAAADRMLGQVRSNG